MLGLGSWRRSGGWLRSGSWLRSGCWLRSGGWLRSGRGRGRGSGGLSKFVLETVSEIQASEEVWGDHVAVRGFSVVISALEGIEVLLGALPSSAVADKVGVDGGGLIASDVVVVDLVLDGPTYGIGVGGSQLDGLGDGLEVLVGAGPGRTMD